MNPNKTLMELRVTTKGGGKSGSGKSGGGSSGTRAGGARRGTRATRRSKLHSDKRSGGNGSNARSSTRPGARPAKVQTRKPRPASRRRSTAKSRNKGWVSRLFTADNLGFLFTTFFSLLIMGLMALAYFMHDLPDISSLTRVTKTPSIVLQTQDGDIMGSSGHIYGEYVRYNDIPRDLIKAVIATEDRSFFRHFGLDPWGLLRAAVANARAGRIVQGGSTITQQLAKNVFLTPERSLKRKVQELIIALALERKYSKEQIITVYLNRVYFGAGTYGIDAAARRYFDKPARKLLLPESAMIAGLLKAPSRYAPTSNRELAVGRARQVLINMVDAGLLQESQQKAAESMYSSISFPEFLNSSGQRYYIDWILDQIPQFVGNIETDLIVTTSFDEKHQQQAEAAVAKIMTDKTVADRKAGQAALLAMRPDGAVLAIVGGRDYAKSQYNRATQARRQPGSAFKLFVYLAALQSGWRPYHTIEDAPITVGNWSPGNYTGRYEGEVTLRYALAHSLNTVAVRLSEAVGRGNVIDMARRLGLKGKMENVPSIALGVTESSLLEMTAAFAHLANHGRLVMPYGIVSIKDVYGNVIYQRRAQSAVAILPDATVRQMNDMLMGVIETGTGRAAAIGRPAAGKTGTSQSYQDAMFVGYTPQLIAGVWVGNDNNRPMARVTGGNLPAQIWAAYMQPALQGVPAVELPRDTSTGSGWWGSGDNERQRPRREQGQQRQNFWDNLFNSERLELQRDKDVPNDPRQRNEGGIRR